MSDEMSALRALLRAARRLRHDGGCVACYLDCQGALVIADDHLVPGAALKAWAGPTEEIELVGILHRHAAATDAARHARYAAALGVARREGGWRVLEARSVTYRGRVVAATMLALGAFDGASEERMVAHMNEDHVDALRDYGRLFGYTSASGRPLLVGVDPDGFDVLADDGLCRCAFDHACASPLDVRKALVALAARARA